MKYKDLFENQSIKPSRINYVAKHAKTFNHLKVEKYNKPTYDRAKSKQDWKKEEI